MLTQIFLHNVNFSARRQKTGNVTIPSLLTSSPVAGPISVYPSVFALRASPDSLRKAKAGGAERDRTDDLKLAKLALSQLSYSPVFSKMLNGVSHPKLTGSLVHLRLLSTFAKWLRRTPSSHVP